MSTLKFWNKGNSESSDVKTDSKNAKNGQRNWLHSPDALINGHVVYLVKFLGNTPVDQPKGIEVVKEAIRRLQFTQQIKKAEGGNNIKMKKVEITISIDGVAIQEPRTNNILHQFPLHKISYCADEKGVKKFFSFIAKMGTSVQAHVNGDSTSINTSSSSSVGSVTAEESHECFVFISNKLASDITLTIGQAFDLAYRRYMSDSGKQFEISKLQSHNKILESTVQTYRNRLREVSEILSKPDLDKLLLRLGIRDICEIQVSETNIDGNKTPDLGIDVSQNDDQLLIEASPKNTFAPIVPPRNNQGSGSGNGNILKPSIGTKLEGLNLLNSDSDSDFDPRADESELTIAEETTKVSNDLFGFEPLLKMSSSGQQLFSSGSFADGTTKTMTTISQPPLLAPPPKKRTNGTQDLFGADPFHPVSSKSGNENNESNNQISKEQFFPSEFDTEIKSFKNPFLNGQELQAKNSLNNDCTMIKNKDDRKTETIDPFKDFARAAFSEFNVKSPVSPTSETSCKQFSKLSNQTNLSKLSNNINIDEFSIESFDPLAK